LHELPLGVFAVAIGTVILPSLARDQATASPVNFSRTLDWALRLILLIGMPASVALMVVGQSIQITLFRYGKTTAHDVLMSSYALTAVSTGLSAFMLIKILAPGFYARQDMKTPVRIGVISMIANMVFNLMLVIPLHLYWRLGHVGLAAAMSLSAWLNAGLLARGLFAAGVFRPEPGWRRFIGQLLLASLSMGLVLWWFDPGAERWLDWPWWQRVAILALLCSAGIIAYFGALGAAGLRPRQLRSPARS
jgi:putative peptidoglycan lipid II flippase